MERKRKLLSQKRRAVIDVVADVVRNDWTSVLVVALADVVSVVADAIAPKRNSWVGKSDNRLPRESIAAKPVLVVRKQATKKTVVVVRMNHRPSVDDDGP